MHPLAYGTKIAFPAHITYQRAGPVRVLARDKQPCQVRFQPARCRRPDTGHQEGLVPFALVLFWCACRSPTWQVQGLCGGRLPGSPCQEAHPVYGIESSIESFTGSERGTSSHVRYAAGNRKYIERRWRCRNPECSFQGHRDVVGSVNMHPLSVWSQDRLSRSHHVSTSWPRTGPGTGQTTVPGGFQPARCSRPDTGHQEGLVRSHWCCFGERGAHPPGRSRASPEAGHPPHATKKLIPFAGSRVSQEI